MPLIKDIQDKNYVGLKDYVGEKIAAIVAGKISLKKDEFLNKVRGITEKGENPFVKKEKDKDDSDKKDSDKEKKPFAKKDDDEDDDKDDKNKSEKDAK